MGLRDFFSWNKPRVSREDLRRATHQCLQASYYSASSDAYSMDWSFATGLGFNDALFADLEKIRNRVRSEFRYGSFAKGMARTYANACVNTGPSLSLESEDEAWARNAESAFNDWASSCGYIRGESLGEMIYLGVYRLFPDGEYFPAFTHDHLADSAVKLRMHMIRPDRVEDPFGNMQPNIREGIEIDANGREVAFHVQRLDPDMLLHAQYPDYDRIPYGQMLHVFRREDPAQLRGEPWFSTGIADMHKRRRYQEHERHGRRGGGGIRNAARNRQSGQQRRELCFAAL